MYQSTLCFRTFMGQLAAGSLIVASALAGNPVPTAQNPIFQSGSGDPGSEIQLMGPGTSFQYRGDFEMATARPGGAGMLTDGWTSIDESVPPNHWNVDAYNNPFSGKAAWCGDLAISSCCAGDPAGGYGNDWRDIMEFRKSVAGAVTVNIQAVLRHDTEPHNDFLTLQRRTAAHPDFEPITGGQGLSWDGNAVEAVNYTFTYAANELVNGTDVAIAFIFESDMHGSDGDCLWPTAGGAIIDDIIVTLTGSTSGVYLQDFEAGIIGPDWTTTPNQGVGDFARVWSSLGAIESCKTNTSQVVAFLDDGSVVPSSSGSVGGPGYDYATPGGWVVNHTGGASETNSELYNSIMSPVMTWPDPIWTGLKLEFDVYTHETLVPDDTPGILYFWSVRSTASGDINDAPWRDRNFAYYGGPSWTRQVLTLDEMIVPGCTLVQVRLSVLQSAREFGSGSAGTGTPAPYFDNVAVTAYPTTGPFLAAADIDLANDGFPATGQLDLLDLAANWVRFDMAASISPISHLRNDPGDSVCIYAAPRAGATMDLPVLHWRFAKRNPMFDYIRIYGQDNEGQVTASPVVSNPGQMICEAVVPNRYRFDLPDGPLEGGTMLFPGDVLHYYFSATDNLASNVQTRTLPADLAGFGDHDPLAWPGAFTVKCLPSLIDATGTQPNLLFWNDYGFAGGEDEWYNAFSLLTLQLGNDFDSYTTHGPSSGVGNGLGGRVCSSLLDAYDVIVYTSGDLGAYALSDGAFNRDPGNDIGLLNEWLGVGDRRLFAVGDDLMGSLHTTSAVSQTFLTNQLGVQYVSNNVRTVLPDPSNLDVVPVEENDVFTVSNWTANDGCVGPASDPHIVNDFDQMTPMPGARTLATFDSGNTEPAVILNSPSQSGDRLISANHDLIYVIDPRKGAAPRPQRVLMLGDVLNYFGIPNDPGFIGSDVIPETVFAVSSNPNPFNPILTIRLSLRQPGPVVMKVFNVRGQLVRTLLDGQVDVTSRSVLWDGLDDQGTHVSSGVYLIETRAGDEVDVFKTALLK